MSKVLLTPSNLQNFSHLILSMSNSEYCMESDSLPARRESEHHKLLYVLKGEIHCEIMGDGTEECFAFTAKKADVCFCPAGRLLVLTPQKGAAYLLFEFRYFGVWADYYSQNSLAVSKWYVPPNTPFELETDVTIERGVAVGLVFGFGSAKNWSCASYDIESKLAHIFGEYGAVQISLSSEQCRLGQTNHLKVVLDSNGTLSYYANEESVGTLSVPEFRGGYLGINSYISHACFSNIRFSIGKRGVRKEMLQPLDGIQSVTGFWKSEGENIWAKNYHAAPVYADRSYLYNETSFPVSPPIEELDILLPRLIHTEGHGKIPFFIREIETEIREHTAGYNNAIKFSVNEILLALFRLSDPASNSVITETDAVCLRPAEKTEWPNRMEFSDIQILSSRASSSYPFRIIGTFPAARVGRKNESLPSSVAERGERLRKFGETVRLCMQNEAPPDCWIKSEERVELRNFLSTACIRFAVKVDRPVSLELAFWDMKNNTCVCFYVHVVRADVWQKFLIPFRKANSRKTGGDYCRLAQEYIALHYGEKISAREIAENVHVTAAYLSRLFREETGQTLRAYLIGYRVEKAKALLSGTNLSLYEIAARVGFYDSAHFFHTFSAREGVSPGEYRANKKR